MWVALVFHFMLKLDYLLTYDNAPIPSHPSTPQSLFDHLNRPWIDWSRPPMTSNDHKWLWMTTNIAILQWLPMTTFWGHFCYILATFRHFQTAFWLHPGYILATFWLHFCFILTTFRLDSDYILAIFRLHSSYIPPTFRLHSDYILTTFWLHVCYILTSEVLWRR